VVFIVIFLVFRIDVSDGRGARLSNRCCPSYYSEDSSPKSAEKIVRMFIVSLQTLRNVKTAH
jgi:hypothetical protein